MFFPCSPSIFIHLDFQTSSAAQTDVEGHVCAVLSGSQSEQRTVKKTETNNKKSTGPLLKFY